MKGNKFQSRSTFKLLKETLNLTPAAIAATLAVKGWKPIIKHLLRVTLIINGGLNNNWVRLTVVTIRRFEQIKQKQGLPGIVKYLKSCSVSLQQQIGGHKTNDITSLGPRVSRTKTGIPRVLPVTIRKRIIDGDPVAIK